MLRSMFFVFLFVFASMPHAALRVDITQGQIQPIPIAIENFTGSTELGLSISDVVRNDLEGCGLFTVIDSNAYLEKLQVSKTPVYSNWRKIEATAIVGGHVSKSAAGIKVEFRMWDPYSEAMIAGKIFNAQEVGWRRIGHKIADEIYKNITREGGFFDTRILFVSESQKGRNKIKKLAIMDQDGANFKTLTDGKSLVLSPSFDRSGKTAIYTYFYNKKMPRVFLLDMATGYQKQLGRVHGISFAPRISNDGSSVLCSIADRGTTSLNAINITSGQLTRILYEPGVISTSPSYSPDGKYIAFNSDRGGSRQIYTMNSDGSSINRISHGSGSYASPTWSPKGDYIAFIKIYNGSFYLGVMRPDGSAERIITSGWLIENPSWAPNGMSLVYSKQERGSGNKLYMIDVTGYHERQVPTPTDASEPSWSQLLQ